MKKYIKPAVREKKVAVQSMIAESPTLGYSSKSADNSQEVLGNGRRGTWGNLWNNDDEE